MPKEQYDIRWKDYYQLLGVQPDADQETIKRIYRRLIQLYHPDVAGASVDQDRIRELNEADEVLSDPERRARYDQFYRTQKVKTEPSQDTSAYEESEDWDAADDWESTADSPPIPTLSPDQVDLGVLRSNETRSLTFSPDNLGGPATQWKLTHHPNEPWLSVTTQSETFPSPITLRINPSLLQPGRRYTAEVIFALDGATTSALIKFHVAGIDSSYEPYEEYEIEKPLEGWASELSYQFPPFRFLEAMADKISPHPDEAQRILPWPSWRWQRLALFGSPPMALFLLFVALAAAAWPLLILAVAWLIAAIYTGVSTSWMRTTSSTHTAAKIAGGSCIIASAITYTISAISIILSIVFMIFFFRIGAQFISEWWAREKAK